MMFHGSLLSDSATQVFALWCSHALQGITAIQVGRHNHPLSEICRRGDDAALSKTLRGSSSLLARIGLLSRFRRDGGLTIVATLSHSGSGDEFGATSSTLSRDRVCGLPPAISI